MARRRRPAPEHEDYVASPRDHWAYQPIDPSQLIKLAAEDIDQSPIDSFLKALRRENGIATLGPAEKSVWLRRVTLDLTGLPPSPEAIHAFENDRSDNAYERVVDRLLASPAYGERWGRHWMDVWRYSDWDGYKQELRGSQRHIWHWRDWIIESLNESKPYDEMIVEMLAGDEIAPEDTDTLRATGFLARNYHRYNRHIWLDATVEHTAKAFLGMTIACARCHDHKFDPISQEQYYRFRAIFEPHEVRTEEVVGEPDINKAGIPRVFDAKPTAETFLLVRGNEKQPRKDLAIQSDVPLDLGIAFQVQPITLPAVAYQPALSKIARTNALEAAWQKYDKARGAAEALLAKEREHSLKAQSKTNVASATTSSADKPAETEKKNSQEIVASSKYKDTKQEPEKPAKEKAAKEKTATEKAATEKPAPKTAEQIVGEEGLSRLERIVLAMRAAESALVALEARYAADDAKVAGMTESDLERLSQKAAVAEQRAALLTAQSEFYTAWANLESARQASKTESEANANNSTDNKPAAKADGKEKEKKKEKGKPKVDAVAQAEKSLNAPLENYRKALEAAKNPPTKHTPVGPVYAQQSTGRRLALAKWIVDPKNPLTARVAVNHMWLRHFGTPLVDEVADFGLRAKRPRALSLLDWLANELMSSGWDMKHLHRQIVLSQTYRLSSGSAADQTQIAQCEKVDADNRLYWRANVRRLDAEEIRDSLLFVAGRLDTTFSGPDLGESEGEKVPRRSVYFRQAYDKQVPMLVLFDGPSPNECYRRSPSILPQQALALSNSQLARELSQALATRLHDECIQASTTDKSAAQHDALFIDKLFQTVLGRMPDEDERKTCREFLSESSADDLANRLPHEKSLAHALINHNDFVVAR